MMFRFIDKPIEHIIYLFPNESPQSQEFSIDPVQSRFEQVSLARILRIKQIQQLQHEFLIDVTFGYVGLEVGRF